MTTLIQSVRKEKNASIYERNLEERGISSLLANIKITIAPDEKLEKYHTKLLSAIKKRVKKYYEESSLEKIETLMKEVSFGFQQISMVSGEESIQTRNIELVRACSIDSQKPYTDFVNQCHPIEIRCQKGKTSYTGYGALRSEIKGSYHHTERYLKKYGRQSSALLFDTATLIAETLLLNSVEQFVKQNRELYRYMFLQTLIQIQRRISLPKDETFAHDIMETAHQYGLEHYLTHTPSMTMDRYRDFFYLPKEEGWIPCVTYALAKSFLVPEFVRQLIQVDEKSKEEIEETKDYAKSFQTKKHITKEKQEKMKHNAFLTRYGYVELDNDVDLEKFAILEQNFEEFTQKAFVPYAPEYSFRIKKLGHHRAAGIHYAHAKATIFDLDHPDAYAHELGHQMDAMGKQKGYWMSEQVAFRPLYERYKKEVEEKIQSLPIGDGFRQEWEGKNKYNRNYYLKTTEVFARCFELYLYTQGIRNSLLKSHYDSPVYPQSEAMIREINLYFQPFMQHAKTTSTH